MVLLDTQYYIKNIYGFQNGNIQFQKGNALVLPLTLKYFSGIYIK